LKINSTSPTGHYYLGLILIKSRNYTEAQKEMELAIANGGDGLALAHKYLGGLYMSANRNKDAADHLEKYLELEPKAKDADQIKTTIKDLRAKS
jgi:tetratricopeptide (TPR) repeat protein